MIDNFHFPRLWRDEFVLIRIQMKVTMYQIRKNTRPVIFCVLFVFILLLLLLYVFFVCLCVCVFELVIQTHSHSDNF